MKPLKNKKIITYLFHYNLANENKAAIEHFFLSNWTFKNFTYYMLEASSISKKKKNTNTYVENNSYVILPIH